MRYFIVASVLMLVACSMPGMGEIEERMEELETTVTYDDSAVNDRLQELEGELADLEVLVTGMDIDQFEGGPDSTGRTSSRPSPGVASADFEGLLESVDELTESLADVPDSIQALGRTLTDLDDSLIAAREDIEEMVLQMDSLALENDSLRDELGSLEWQISDLRTQFNQIGARSGDSGSGGTRPGTEGGTTGGSTGGRDSGGSSGGGGGR